MEGRSSYTGPRHVVVSLVDGHTAFGAAFASGAVSGGSQSVTTLKVGAGQAGPINIVVDDIQLDRAVLPGP